MRRFCRKCPSASAASAGPSAAVPQELPRRGPPLPPSAPACRTGSAQLRCNIIIALGDLALRFPNLLEPYTGKGCRGLAATGSGAARSPLLSPLPCGTEVSQTLPCIGKLCTAC